MFLVSNWDTPLSKAGLYGLSSDALITLFLSLDCDKTKNFENNFLLLCASFTHQHFSNLKLSTNILKRENFETLLLTTYMEQKPWKTDRRLSIQEIPRILWR
jgi:hypothetical protein